MKPGQSKAINPEFETSGNVTLYSILLLYMSKHNHNEPNQRITLMVSSIGREREREIQKNREREKGESQRKRASGGREEACQLFRSSLEQGLILERFKELGLFLVRACVKHTT